MAEIVKFPIDRVEYDFEGYRPEPATILVLPIVRVERYPEDATMWNDDGRLIPIR